MAELSGQLQKQSRKIGSLYKEVEGERVDAVQKKWSWGSSFVFMAVVSAAVWIGFLSVFIL
jgi:hypothetical protein